MRVLGLLITVLCAVFTAGCGTDDAPHPPADPADGFAPGTVRENVYDNAAYRFRFTVPAGWRLQEGGPADSTESSVLLVAGINEQEKDTFMMNAQKGFRRTRMSAYERLDHMFAAVRKRPGFTETACDTLSVGGVPAARLLYRVGNGRPERFIVFVHHDRTITFAATAPEAMPAALRADIASLIASLEFY